jgi:glutamine amidotransferase
MQLLFSSSTENEFTNGLNLLKGKVIRFNNENTPNLVPRVDWAKTDFFITDGITLGLEKIEYMYYVHSFYVVPEGDYSILSESYYCDVKYCSGIKYKNIYAFQFHPEKSSIKGLLLIRNFLAQVAKFKGE